MESKTCELEVLAIIPARGGSKGVIRKNIKPLDGVPLVAYTIDDALCAELVGRVVVSTDDEDIAAQSRAYGAEVVMRPRELSTDDAPSELALIHVLDRLRIDSDYLPDLIVFLQCTSPLRRQGDIDEAIKFLIANDYDSVFSGHCCYHFKWQSDDDRLVPGNFEFGARKMRQDKQPDYVEDGSFYVLKPGLLQKSRQRLGGKVGCFETSPLYSFEIDTHRDFSLFNRLIKLRERQLRAALPENISLIVFDFDGVMTDNKVLVDQNGVESVRCSRSDSVGLNALGAAGFEMVVLSTETNAVVNARCEKLNLHCYQGCENKLALLQDILSEKGIDKREVVYIGNDINDLECMEYVGFSIAMKNAYDEVKRVADFVTSREGGAGAVREVADLLLQSRKCQNERSYQCIIR